MRGVEKELAACAHTLDAKCRGRRRLDTYTVTRTQGGALAALGAAIKLETSRPQEVQRRSREVARMEWALLYLALRPRQNMVPAHSLDGAQPPQKGQTKRKRRAKRPDGQPSSELRKIQTMSTVRRRSAVTDEVAEGPLTS